MTANRQLATSGSKKDKQVRVPRLRPTKLDTLQHVRTQLGMLFRDARQGRLATSDATRLAFILGEIRKAIVSCDIEARLAALEAEHDND